MLALISHLWNVHKSYNKKGSADIKFARRLISFQRLYGFMLSDITRKSYLATLEDHLILGSIQSAWLTMTVFMEIVDRRVSTMITLI